ncbi:zinc-dependent alcohol dehydrogenase family protein [Methylobacterium sp. R2-1]|uniref:zinc-dependent alcohol dehydrogenase family protein n=1 Tax=Methylobacterium sp. R2-1 TaxID=2587064 RepID=UPI00161395C4|nr:zinc-dependent alcohol dehydrogenase family protein [Methylobacterium sp. R2-1]MBB2961449.1 NADPH:quinone reductase-like Zn-dependent oxidoreductase [Methylobacterium sp. R2-1]
MKAMVLTKFGGPDSFELRDLPDPRPGPRQVRVAVHATSINPLDGQIRRGDYADQVELPAVIGHDVSGVVDQVGSHVTKFRVGDEVYYTPRIFSGPGSYAEYHVADADIVARKPVNLTHSEAASVSLVGVTVWEGLVERARLQVTETVLIHGGAGGVGAIAVQVAKAIGARVLATARGSDAALVERLGASAVIDFEREDYVDAVNRLTEGRGVDVVLDTIGRDTLSRSPRILREDGRVVTLVDTATPQNLIDAWGRNATYHFVFSRQNGSKLDALSRLLERGLVVPQVAFEFPLDAVARAHARLEEGRLKGKIVLRVRS